VIGDKHFYNRDHIGLCRVENKFPATVAALLYRLCRDIYFLCKVFFAQVDAAVQGGIQSR
jgi:hypothetical protein